MKLVIILLGSMIVTLSCGVGSDAPTEKRELDVATVLEGSVRRHEVGMRIGSAPIYEGHYVLAADGNEFRACGLDEKYLVDASFSDQDTLYVFIQSQSMIQANQIYVRFHGEVIESVDGLPDHYADVIRITELLAYSVAAPSPCK